MSELECQSDFSDEVLVRVVAPHFVAGIVFNEKGVCIEAAPILHHCVGMTGQQLRLYFDRKGWEANRV